MSARHIGDVLDELADGLESETLLHLPILYHVLLLDVLHKDHRVLEGIVQDKVIPPDPPFHGA